VILSADTKPMRQSLEALNAAFNSWSPSVKHGFMLRYRALTQAGAEWSEVTRDGDTMRADVSDDLRRLCAEFGVVL
jgi:hypothetical protein